ncbi:MAG TPA: TonB C-terminal domain-containing protein [Candidatus Dormibacteraeota bacterium]|nr:TonB C-terminal domain-containing protein [Candidatus Dormibacteraeota bacterium]
MIRRTLVPVNVRPVDKDEAKKAPQRLTTLLDERTVVPSQLSNAPPLNGHTSIPAHLPLGVLVTRSLVPRGMEVKQLGKIEHASTLPLDILNSRMVVPTDVNPLTEEQRRTEEKPHAVTPELREVVAPDIFTTGDANLLIGPEDKNDSKRDLTTRVLSVLVHVSLILFLLFAPKLFPEHTPTDQEIALAKRQLQWIYTPPPMPRVQPSPRIHISPRALNKVAPPVVQPPAPPVETPKAPELPKQAILPEAPRVQNQQTQPVPAPPKQAPSQLEAIQPPAPRPRSHLNLGLSNSSPGQEIQDQIRNAIKNGHGQSGGVYGGPPAPGMTGPGMGQGYQILSDTQGVDFTSYIQRLLATLKRNWDAVMPQSAMMGDRGVVYTTFQINPDGSVPPPDPILERTSGKQPLDNAAMSAIHASNPFEPLPSAFHGPYLRLRIVFLYNVTPAQAGLR